MLKFFKKERVYRNLGDLSVEWIFGFSLFLFFIFQLVTGFLLSLYYDVGSPYFSLDFFERENEIGWFFNIVHSLGASFFFFFLFLHFLRINGGFIFPFGFSFFIGLLWLLLSIFIGVLGYWLPWGQLSFWGIVVLSNIFLRILTFIFFFFNVGVISSLLYGDIFISSIFLHRVLSFHFLFPFILLLISILHVFFVHVEGSSFFDTFDSESDELKEGSFFYSFLYKDLFLCLLLWILFFFLCFYKSELFYLVSHKLELNKMSTPEVIQPEWYLWSSYFFLESSDTFFVGINTFVLYIVFLFFFLFRSESISIDFSFILFFFIFNRSILIKSFLFPLFLDGILYNFLFFFICFFICYFLDIIFNHELFSFYSFMFSFQEFDDSVK